MTIKELCLELQIDSIEIHYSASKSVELETELTDLVDIYYRFWFKPKLRRRVDFKKGSKKRELLDKFEEHLQKDF